MNSVALHNGVTFGGGKLVLMAGPCMAESLEVCLESGTFLKKLASDLGIGYVFKASYDKANRTSGKSRRGPGLKQGLKILAEIREKLDVPVITDVHESCDVPAVAAVADMLQIPAFLCRQTDLLAACGRTGKPVNIKKGQFMAPEDMLGAVEKVRQAGSSPVLLTERGSSFGYHNLVVDFRSLEVMRRFGVPVVFDATHSVQLPGGLGSASGGNREYVRPLARAAAAIGIDALFAEVHPRPEEAWSDGANSLDFKAAETVVKEVKAIFDLMTKREA